MNPLDKRACENSRCGWTGTVSDLLVADDPFNPGDKIFACPQCRQYLIHTCCDEPGCFNQDTCGWLPADGMAYRRTCYTHMKPMEGT